jgi:hypothetical protein
MEKLETGSWCTNFTNNSYFKEELPDIRTRNNPLRHKDILYYTRVCILKDKKSQNSKPFRIKKLSTGP